MKHILKKTCLLWLSLLFIFSIVWFIGVTNLANWENGENGVTINTDPTDLHRPSLYSLFLSGDDSQSWMASLSNDFLSVLNWLIVWNNNNANGDEYVFIGWGVSNSVTNHYAWIWWGSGNRVSNHWGAIGWWKENGVAWDYGVIVWGFRNRASNYGVVVWWQDHIGDNKWIILWWKDNVAWDGSLVLWNKAKWGDYSFAWNKWAGDYEAWIQANNWVLIWTYKAKTWVALVVSGAIKLSTELDKPEDIWEMRNNGWCIEVDDGGSLHVLGKTSESECNAWMWCIFGKTKMQDGDTLVGYTKSYTDGDCEDVAKGVKCNNWNLIPSDAYPYCYKISPASNPTNPRALPLVP